MKLQLTVAAIGITVMSANADAKLMCVGIKPNGHAVALSPRTCMQNTGKPYNFSGDLSYGRMIPDNGQPKSHFSPYTSAYDKMASPGVFNYFMTKQAR